MHLDVPPEDMPAGDALLRVSLPEPKDLPEPPAGAMRADAAAARIAGVVPFSVDHRLW